MSTVRSEPQRLSLAKGAADDARGQPRSRGSDRLQTLAKLAGHRITADSAKKKGIRARLASRVGKAWSTDV